MSIHSTAIIDPKAELASDVEVGPFAVIGEGVKIAKGKLLVFIDSDTRPEDEYFLEVIWSHYVEKQFDMATGKLMIDGNSLLEKVANKWEKAIKRRKSYKENGDERI